MRSRCRPSRRRTTARDGRGIFVLTDHGGEFAELRYVDMFNGEQKVLAPQSRGDAERFDISIDGHFIAYTLNEGGLDRLVLHDLTQQADMLLPALPNGALIRSLRFSRDGKRLAITLETAQSPADIYVLSVDAPTPTLARWTQSELGPIDASKLVAKGFSEITAPVLLKFSWQESALRQTYSPALQLPS